MRAVLLAIVAIQLGLAGPASAQNPTAPGKPAAAMLPLFEKNNCTIIKDPADQLFCGDPELNSAAVKLNGAIAARLERIADRRLAIEENAGWIRSRNLSCGILGRQSVPERDINSVKACLLKETGERVDILSDPNYDCLASNTTAGMLICSDPGLAIADKELSDRVVALIAKLKDDEAREAFSEYARWNRGRDRKCDLVGKDNVPFDELPSSEGCLSNYIAQKTAEVVAAKGDPKRVFGRNISSPAPDADAVDLCVAQIHAANSCENFIRVSRVSQIDSQTTNQTASVTAEVEMVVLSPFALCSPVASNCTGTCWDSRLGQAKPNPGTAESFAVSRRLRIVKSFAFQKADKGGWSCNSPALPPVDRGTVAAGP